MASKMSSQKLMRTLFVPFKRFDHIRCSNHLSKWEQTSIRAIRSTLRTITCPPWHIRPMTAVTTPSSFVASVTPTTTSLIHTCSGTFSRIFRAWYASSISSTNFSKSLISSSTYWLCARARLIMLSSNSSGMVIFIRRDFFMDKRVLQNGIHHIGHGNAVPFGYCVELAN
jgi:hypothetical protein